MNIFILSTNPVEAASMQCNKHVVKMILETAQMLSTISGGPLKPTHQNHPCTLWAGRNRTNYEWLARHGLALCQEYTLRYGKVHSCQSIIERLAEPPSNIPVGISEFVQCMPDQYKHKDPVTAYRRYYHSKARFAKWRQPAEIPFWWMNDEFLPYVS